MPSEIPDIPPDTPALYGTASRIVREFILRKDDGTKEEPHG